MQSSDSSPMNVADHDASSPGKPPLRALRAVHRGQKTELRRLLPAAGKIIHRWNPTDLRQGGIRRRREDEGRRPEEGGTDDLSFYLVSWFNGFWFVRMVDDDIQDNQKVP